ncbi:MULTISPECIES: molybdopterin-dependent oxidoreductase [Novosphingobium]|uniref:Oxidoreductase, molybdopterin binding n=1 Tax=Novosphingobium pentaromativorans US6-1 TaxID=1088721 RepID=G6ECM7_9SPHN|nr:MULTISPECIES: molybdopterin-dependent oxidoreductase [Novosphingobium]AIT80013.1 molybdopterin-binding protein [Novosphingobium pentaromativorans US6-1]EHJ60938.1 oxidoreductase, molybdopterin binding [Novosphingobium pentaromativorans US6-1]GFM28243.1 oxidoreductase, molybdopterin binding [Novosphingobium sp. PY1]
MSRQLILSRRTLIRTGVVGTGGLLLSGCDKLFENPAFRSALESGEDLHKASQRALGRNALAREFSAGDMSPVFRANGSREGAGEEYRRHLAQGFANWSLKVDGLVERPLAIPLTALRQLPQRKQITRHDCVEGWSAIGQWQGPRLAQVLDLARLKPEAQYIVFHCADLYRGRPYYESIDLVDAFHPQTILAWQMNGRPLEQQHGAPLRLRVEKQLGYKHAKFVTRIEARASLDGLYGGRGGYWEDQGAYAWYAGI